MKTIHKRLLAYIKKTSPNELNFRMGLPFLGLVVLGRVLSEVLPDVEGLVASVTFVLLAIFGLVVGYMMRIKGVIFSPGYPKKVLGITASDIGGCSMIVSGFLLFLIVMILADRFVWPHVQRFLGVTP
jgi:hypothetical protein